MALALAAAPSPAAAARHAGLRACPLPHAFARLAKDEMDDYDTMHDLAARFLRYAPDPAEDATVADLVMDQIGMPDHTPGHPRLSKLPDGLALVSGLDPQDPRTGSALVVDECGHVLAAAYTEYPDTPTSPPGEIVAFVDKGISGGAHLVDLNSWWRARKYRMLEFRLPKSR